MRYGLTVYGTSVAIAQNCSHLVGLLSPVEYRLCAHPHYIINVCLLDYFTFLFILNYLFYMF